MWVDWLSLHLKEEISLFKAGHSKSIHIPVSSLSDRLYKQVLDDFPKAKEYARAALVSLGLSDFWIRFVKHPLKIPVKSLKSDKLGRFVSIEGTIRSIKDPQPYILTAAFKCLNCEHIEYIPQNEKMLEKPDILCCSKPRFILDVSHSTIVDSQSFKIQEQVDGGVSSMLEVLIFGDEVGVLNAGDRVIVNGVLKAYRNQKDTLALSLYFEGNSIEVKDREFSEISISEDDEKRILEYSKSDNLLSDFVSAIAPTIYGFSEVKEAVALQLFGGTSLKYADGTTKRGDIHVLLVGDPGISKSKLLQSVLAICPRGILVSGKSTSSAGLTATAIKDADGSWTLEAGATVIADNGQLLIDEVDKMSEQDTSSLHQALEQQCYSDDTEVLTKDGWKFFKDVSYTDYFATLNSDGVLEYHNPSNIICKKYSGDMVYISSRQVNLLVTHDHNIYASVYKHGNEFYPFDFHKPLEIESKKTMFKKSAEWVGEELNEYIIPALEVPVNQNASRIYPEIKVPMDLWLEFLGYYLSEGCCPIYTNGDYYRINISQKKEKNIPIIDSCVKKLGFTCKEYDGNGWYINSKQIAYHMKTYGKQRMRYVPQYVKNLSKRQIQIFLNAFLLGDGHKDAKGFTSYTTSSPMLANDIQELLLKTGVSGNIHTRLNVAKARGPIYVVKTISKNTPVINSNGLRQVSHVSYSGNVYCVTVPNHIIYVRREGKPIWCGNCVSVAKAGIITTLNSRCSLLAAMNPKLGRFDDIADLAEQINLPPTLLSRFDLIFILLDHPDADKDKRIATHIINGASVTGDIQFLRKYVAYAKRNIFPKLSEAAKSKITEYYCEVRGLSSRGKSVPLTARQLEALVRLCEASARMRLSNEVSIEDAEVATRVLDTCLRGIAYDAATGTFDIDKAHNKMSRNSREKAMDLLSICKTLSEDNPYGWPIETLCDICTLKPRADLEKELQKLIDNNLLFMPKTGKYKIV